MGRPIASAASPAVTTMTPKRAAWPSQTCQRGATPSVAAFGQVPADQQQQRRIGRQHVMRQLGRQQFADDPVGQVPGEQEGEARVGAEAVRVPPARPRRRARRTATGTARRSARSSPAGSRAIPGRRRPCPACPCRPIPARTPSPTSSRWRRPMARPAGRRAAMPRSGFQVAQPAAVAIRDGERGDGEHAEQRNDRPLDQDGGGLGNPEQPRRVAVQAAGRRGRRDRSAPARLAPAPRWQAAPRRSWRCAPRRPARKCRPAQLPRSARRDRPNSLRPVAKVAHTAMMPPSTETRR